MGSGLRTHPRAAGGHEDGDSGDTRWSGTIDDEGHDVLEASQPKEFPELTTALRPRGEKVSFGAHDPDAPAVGLGERMLRHLPAASTAIPAGDFRDWAAIDAWASEIAHELGAEAHGRRSGTGG